MDLSKMMDTLWNTDEPATDYGLTVPRWIKQEGRE